MTRYKARDIRVQRLSRVRGGAGIAANIAVTADA
jgi:hypothetical protein